MNKSTIRTSNQIRQEFLNFFNARGHTIVPSSSLMPESPNLLFTNAGMNQFVPIFLGKIPCPYNPPRAADTQKCIRAGGKHNDLEDVGLDTYHHTFFEMLGNWSFGDYFKKEAINWAWELLTDIWGFPKNRLYATVYKPGPGEPSEQDDESYEYWRDIFQKEGFDSKIHIKFGNKKDNFWMMGETGPCGPCSEIHIDLTPSGDTKGELVNKGSHLCIEVWNLVFMQFNANPDGSLSLLPSKNVDTGMGFERVVGIIQCTEGFKKFTSRISNYETDIFKPIFDKLEQISKRKYSSTLPSHGGVPSNEQEKIDIAFRVIADHIRTVSFAIADGILPSNNDRNYVIRRILRRAIRYGRVLGFREPFFYKLVDTVTKTMGDVFPEVRTKQSLIEETIGTEEESFNKTLDRGIELFEQEISNLKTGDVISGDFAFKLYDTYGFPFDLTQLMAKERGFTVDSDRFNKLMDEQRTRARKAQKRELVEVTQINNLQQTRFVGYEALEAQSKVLQVLKVKNKNAVILDVSPCYAEMGGQVGDTGEMTSRDGTWKIVDTQKTGDSWLHFIEGNTVPSVGSEVFVKVDTARRAAIQRHHTATHLLHWAIHHVISPEALQKGSSVDPNKLTLDFNSQPLTDDQKAKIEWLVNEQIIKNSPVSWIEIPYEDARSRKDIIQVFGEKYGSVVRVIQVGGTPGKLDGYAMELCGGTHVKWTGEIGLFRIINEYAVAAGIRRIEACAGTPAIEKAIKDDQLIKLISQRLSTQPDELDKKLESLLQREKDLQKQILKYRQREANEIASKLLAQHKTKGSINYITHNLGDIDSDFMVLVLEALRQKFDGLIVLGGISGASSVQLVAAMGSKITKELNANTIIQKITPIVGGKGGGKPDFARGGGKDPTKLDQALAAIDSII